MQVITGSARGRKLITVEGTDLVRPTAQKVKEAIFSAIQFEIEGAEVLDLFAGSGQLGIEALSRGAKFCTFADNSPVSLKVVRENIRHTGFEDCSDVVNKPFGAFLKLTGKHFDLAFLDPPYNKKILQKALPELEPKMTERGIIVCEHEKECALPKNLGRFTLTRTLAHGTISVSFYRIVSEDDEV